MQISRIFLRTAAAVSAAFMLGAMPFPAGAETVLPSGYDAEHLNQKIDMMTGRQEANQEFAPVIGAKVFCGDEIVSTVCSGMADRDAGYAVDEDTVFEWGSITKTMIWVSIMQLWEQGKLSLDADISGYLPADFAFQHREFDDPVTLTDIMNHRSGWCETTYAIATDDAEKIPSLMDALMQTEPVQVYQPDTVTAYSNWASALAALAVEQVSGRSFTDYVHENILEPLGMEHTAVAADHSDNPWVQQQRQHLHFYSLSPITAVRDLGTRITYITLYPSGAAVGTVNDLCTYAQALTDPDSPLFKDPATHEKLFSGTFFAGDQIISSCGFAASQFGVQVFGHDGRTSSGTAQMLFDPVTRIGVVAATTDQTVSEAFINLPVYVFGEPEPSDVPESAGEPVSPKGYYISSRSQMTGLLSFMRLQNPVAGEQLGTLYPVGGGLYRPADTDDSVLVRVSDHPDGQHFSIGLTEYIPMRGYLAKLALFSLYTLLGITAIFALLIDIKRRRAGKLNGGTGAAVLTAAKCARILSLAAAVAMLAFTMTPETMGLPRTAGTVCGCIQIVCAAVCTIGAVTGGIGLFQKNAAKLNAVSAVFCNAAVTAAIAVFELYRFWYC